MTDYKFVDVSDDTMDMVVEAEFASPFPPLKMQALLREVAEALEMGIALPIFLEGLSAFQVGEKRIEISFRFSRKPDDIATLGENERDELSRTRTKFVIHIFAKLDRVHKLGSVPFPTDFRNFIAFTR